MPRVLIEIHEGMIVRDLLENGLLNMLSQAGLETLLVTPGAQVAEFRQSYQTGGVAFTSLTQTPSLTRAEGYEAMLGSVLSQKGFHRARRWLWSQLGEGLAAENSAQEARLLDEWKPSLVVSTHLSQMYGRRLVASARKRGIQTLGNLKSWDNVWKGLHVRPDVVTCWSENNRKEICQMESYFPENVRVIGSPAFDAYYAVDSQWTRDAFCRTVGLDPARQIILFASLGQFKQQIDETNPLEVLMRSIDSGEIHGKPQVVLRLHPWSREVFFKRFLDRPDVVLSRYENYIPGLSWTPTREETILAGNLLRHANLVISPGSTMSIEPAIFDTPVLVSVFNEYMPEIFDKYFKQTWLDQHFNRLYRNNWLPIVRSGADMISAVNRSLEDKSWYGTERQLIRNELLGPLDGRATERLAGVIQELVYW